LLSLFGHPHRSPLVLDPCTDLALALIDPEC
jgi:hypothetical protein